MTSWTLFSIPKSGRGIFQKPTTRIPNRLIIHLHPSLHLVIGNALPVIGPSFWQSPSHLFAHHHYLHKRALLNKTSRKKHHQTLKVPIQPHAESHPAPAQPHQNSWTVTPFPNFVVIVPSHLSCRPIIKDTRLYNKPQVLVSFAIAASHSLHARVFVDTLHCQSFDQFLHSFPLAT